MNHRPTFVRRTVVVLISIVLVLAPAATASAAAPSDKPAVLARWTQTSAASSAAWYAALQNRDAWAAYGFDWATDYCSASPDQPLGFDFRRSCHRHDFGYRNHKAAGIFPANKARVDDAFYADLKRTCATYAVVVRPACLSLAWTYFSAVVVFGKVAVSDAQLQQAARLKADALRNA
jgi:hypothetical protein